MECGGQAGRLAVDDLLPGVLDFPGVGGGEVTKQIRFGNPGEIGDGSPMRLGIVSDAPDPAAQLVPFGVGPGDFVVGDDLIVPVDDVEAAIGSEREGDGTEPGIAAEDEVGEVFEPPAIAPFGTRDRC